MSKRSYVSGRVSGQKPTRIGSMGRRTVSIVLLVFLAAISLKAQDATFEASVDRNPVGMGEQFTLSLTLGNGGMGGGKNLQLPDLSKFHIMAGPNQSTSMQIINGAVSSSLTYSYVLQPKEMGKLTIGAASIEAGGKKYTTAPLTIEVVKGSPRPKQQANVPDDLNVQIGENLFLKAVVDKSHVMQGEQINLTFKIYTRVSIANYAVNKNPALTGFWGEDTENPKNIALTNETINGKQYRVGVIKRMALFPTQSGTLEISPMELQTVVQVQSRRSADPFDSFFSNPFGQNVNYMVKSEPLKIKVDPLPAGAPSGFKGAVGRFTMNTVVDKKSTRTNEPISLKVNIAGTGNIKLLESPEVDLPTDFEQYTPKVSDNINREEGRISGTKTFEYLLIPRYPGRKVIKPVMFSYFDVAKRDYVTLRSSEIEVTVEQGTAQATPLIAGGAREDIQLLSQDIRFIKVSSGTLSRKGEYVHTSGTFIALLLLPLGCLAGAFVYARRRRSVMMDEIGYRNRKAIKLAQKGLREADVLLKGATPANDQQSSKQKLQFYAEISRALWKYLCDKLNISQADLSIDGTLAMISQRSANTELTASLKSLLESCEMARFAPTSLEVATMRKTYEDAKRLIVELEQTLNTK